MVNNLRIVSFLILSIFFCENSFAQLDNQHTVGVRFGSATGVSYRYSLSENRALEGILSVQSSSRTSRFRVVGLYQYHKPIADNFSWYYGFGGSFGSMKYKAYKNAAGEHIDSSSDLLLSVDGIIGIAYDIPTTPLSVSLDAKPYLDFLQESSIKWVDPIGFTIRYKF
ncbi:hypothetical protein G5B30_12625 [Sphingobacterium sp. SGG-5]|uniref:hypothetical protein n=1 Tax=Sphingobacterium sp. SGG-5 TaxID=2710881 RepID=UPI0013ECF240|nr:hypothetical protein [Sphingobacterium sp. SGG-5]NGM62758.1 hypothetical protein [Sphingobacterium sp. SGG-5]